MNFARAGLKFSFYSVFKHKLNPVISLDASISVSIVEQCWNKSRFWCQLCPLGHWEVLGVSGGQSPALLPAWGIELGGGDQWVPLGHCSVRILCAPPSAQPTVHCSKLPDLVFLNKQTELEEGIWALAAPRSLPEAAVLWGRCSRADWRINLKSDANRKYEIQR